MGPTCQCVCQLLPSRDDGGDEELQILWSKSMGEGQRLGLASAEAWLHGVDGGELKLPRHGRAGKRISIAGRDAAPIRRATPGQQLLLLLIRARRRLTRRPCPRGRRHRVVHCEGGAGDVKSRTSQIDLPQISPKSWGGRSSSEAEAACRGEQAVPVQVRKAKGRRRRGFGRRQCRKRGRHGGLPNSNRRGRAVLVCEAATEAALGQGGVGRPWGSSTRRESKQRRAAAAAGGSYELILSSPNSGTFGFWSVAVCEFGFGLWITNP
ncbi:hypothetical protein BRADI_3g11583v3 [Brachypodium distachyon]|uniref:Uncharacterized protein n=1 Tax=Brachypodium distachyon TaxID=15368 RepID=A0A0Q3F570_BRADI|nr:hypothetical protein BRADI_3g11583v3 [Brachypodium distachyon]